MDLHESGYYAHVIPQSHLKSFSINGTGGEKTATCTDISINGIKAGKWIREVQFHGIADKNPCITVIGRLDRLDDEIKESWGIK